MQTFIAPSVLSVREARRRWRRSSATVTASGVLLSTSPPTVSRAQAITLSACIHADVRSDGAVVFDLGTGRCYSFNGLGAEIIRILNANDQDTLPLIAQVIRASHPDAPARLETDVDAFLKRLADLGLIHTGGRHRNRRPADSPLDDPAMPPAEAYSKPEPAPRRVTPLQYLAAWLCLAACDLALRFGGVRALRSLLLGFRRRPSRSWSRTRAHRLGEALDAAAAYYYKHTWCLHRAAAKACFLRLHGIPARTVVGYRAMPFFAHAWVQCGDHVLNEPDRLRTALRPIPLF